MPLIEIFSPRRPPQGHPARRQVHSRVRACRFRTCMTTREQEHLFISEGETGFALAAVALWLAGSARALFSCAKRGTRVFGPVLWPHHIHSRKSCVSNIVHDVCCCSFSGGLSPPPRRKLVQSWPRPWRITQLFCLLCFTAVVTHRYLKCCGENSNDVFSGEFIVSMDQFGNPFVNYPPWCDTF